MDRNIPFDIIRPAIDVALRKESVDRNLLLAVGVMLGAHVALRKESVDRNQWIKSMYPGCRVALRKESVDRNCLELSPWGAGGVSLSARRAWIEISTGYNGEFGLASRSPQGERG